MRVTIETIAHKDQRYPTVGDWFFDEEGNLHIKVSQLDDWRKEMLIAVHELVEVVICKHNGVTQEQVDQFDMEYEKNRLVDDESEPGDDSKAPYRRQHCIATAVERLLAAELGVDWNAYADAVEALL